MKPRLLIAIFVFAAINVQGGSNNFIGLERISKKSDPPQASAQKGNKKKVNQKNKKAGKR